MVIFCELLRKFRGVGAIALLLCSISLLKFSFSCDYDMVELQF